MKKLALSMLLLFIPAMSKAAIYDLEPIKIYSLNNNGQDAANTQNIPNSSSGVDIQTRVDEGILQDISIRGGTFEDADVRMNGVNLDNPQTGHFNLALPIVSTDIINSKVDLNGQYIDYNLKMPQKNEAMVRVSAGNGGYADTLISASFGKNNTFNRFSYEGMRTDGLLPQTDADKNAVSYTFFHDADFMTSKIYASYLNKNYGAGGAYGAPWYMAEEEHLEQHYLMSQLTFKQNLDLELTPYIYRTDDTFFLNRDDRTHNRNDHTMYVYGNNAKSFFLDRLFYGELDVREESIDSTNLLEHNRLVYEMGLGQEEKQFGKFGYNFYGGLLSLDGYPYKFTPKAGIFYDVAQGWRVTLDAARKYRQPSFTELYYYSPSSHGNNTLVPQQSSNYELGLTRKSSGWLWRVNGFYRHQENTIDWVKNNSDTFYRAINAGQLEARGFDLKWQYDANWKFLKRISAEYTGLFLNKQNNWDMSKYAFEYLQDRLVCKFEQSIGKWDFDVSYIYEDHISQKGRSLVNGGVVYKMAPRKSIFLRVDNLFDFDYYELPYIRGTPVSVKGGMEIKF
ncbi:MAG: TonB-dependent receptor [Candidatus Omnitrophica bacterium]|nr:TonB-dependent receptor [Candidatus Omnitrophota bacterium]